MFFMLFCNLAVVDIVDNSVNNLKTKVFTTQFLLHPKMFETYVNKVGGKV